VALTDNPQRLLMAMRAVRPGDRISGPYGRDFKLYEAWRDKSGPQLRALELPTSMLSVPRNCYALNGEDVGYGIGVRKGASVAVESQIVVCDGGPRSAQGPYRAQSDVIESGSGWHVTEMARLAGQPRYLAAPGTCDPQFSLRTEWCAEPGIRYLQTHPGEQELDLIAAKGPVKAGDILDAKQIEQWVLKRKGSSKFKADSRWVNRSMLSPVDGCTAVEPVRWYVESGADGLYIAEKALNRCGAPLAPVPADIYEAYGQDMYIVDCAQHRWRDRDQAAPDGCFDQARDYLKRVRQTSAYVVVLNQAARLDDRLYDGSFISYDVARVSLNKNGGLEVRRVEDYMPSVYLRNCTSLNDGQAESRGFVIVRSLGVSWARPYVLMSCPVSG
jgi:hypothetical protein